MAKLPSRYLNTAGAADLLNYSEGYLAYLRTETAKERGHAGPPYVRVDLKDGSQNPIRIKYDREAILEWAAERQKLRDRTPPSIQYVAG